MRKGMRLYASICLLLLLAMASQAPSRADQRDFPITYSWFQSSQGEHEIELHEHYGNKSKEYVHQIEFEYGVSNRFLIAPYLVYSQDPDRSLHLEGVQLETRYQLGNYRTGRWLPGLYLEFEKPVDETAEIEGKIILSQFDIRGSDLSINLQTERTLTADSSQRYAVTAGWEAPLGRCGARGGFELYKSIDSGRINGGPVIAFRTERELWMTAGYAPALNGHGNEQQLNATLEYEF